MEAPTSLQYMTKFTDLEEERKVREYEFFSGISPKLSYGGFCLHLKRISTPYLLNYYLPSALFVCVSWTSYTIPVDAIPGRIALIVTTFLSLVNIANSAFETSPQNQGINLMQVPIFYFESLKHILFGIVSFCKRSGSSPASALSWLQWWSTLSSSGLSALGDTGTATREKGPRPKPISRGRRGG